MKAMILAAGVGERMRPLTDHTPKPMLPIAGMPLIEHHIRHLAAAGFADIVINVSHLAQQIIDFCGDGGRWGVDIAYSPEPEPLETAGGILNAMPLLDDAPFLIVNGDVWVRGPYEKLRSYQMRPTETARLLMVGNPEQHPMGDFHLDADGWIRVLTAGAAGVTYAGVGIYTPAFFVGMTPGKLPLRPLLDAAISEGRLGGEFYDGEWQDVGTPERLRVLDLMVTSRG